MRNRGSAILLVFLIAWVAALNHVAMGYCACADEVVVAGCGCETEDDGCGFGSCVDWITLDAPDFVALPQTGAPPLPTGFALPACVIPPPLIADASHAGHHRARRVSHPGGPAPGALLARLQSYRL